MKEKIVIVGNSHFAEVVYEHIKQDTKWDILAFAANKKYIDRDSIETIPVISIEELDSVYKSDEILLVMAVGYGNGNRTREKMYQECVEKGFSFTNFIHSSVVCSKKVSWGDGNIVFPGVTIDSFVKIGNGNIFLPQVMVGHDVEIGNFCAISGGSLLGGSAKIGDRSFMGMGAIIKDQIILENDVYIGASAYVHKNVVCERCVLPLQAKYMNERESKMFKELYGD